MSSLPQGASPSRVDRITPLARLLLVLIVLGLTQTAQAVAVPAGPHWSIVSQSEPTHFKAGDSADAYRLIARNDGALPTTRASKVIVVDTLPKEVTATKVSARAEGANGIGSPRYELNCAIEPLARTVTCTYEEDAGQGVLPPGTTIVMTITVSISNEAKAPVENSATVSGGGAQSASVSESTAFSTEPVPFGLAYLTAQVTNESGEAETQAGSHPFELTTSLAFNITSREVGGNESPLSTTSPRDLEIELPPGLVGSPNAVPRCSQQEFQAQEGLGCPLDTQVGTATIYGYGAFHSAVYPLYDILPPPEQPVELGFTIANVGHVPMFFGVRNGGDYGLTARLNNLPEGGPPQGAILTLWGVPADRSHDLEREGTLGQGRQQAGEVCQPLVTVSGGVEHQTRCPSGVAAKPFLTLPSSCPGQSLLLGVFTDSWQGQSFPLDSEPQPRPTLPALTGCEHLSFGAAVTVQPETAQAGAPSGYTVHLHIPQNEDPTELATPDLRKIVVTLPAGTVLSPSSGDGLQGCTDSQFGLHDAGSASCPAASTIGTVQIATPALASPLEGQVFLRKPTCEPCSAKDAQDGNLIRLLVQAQGSGVTVKLEGVTSIDQTTGRLTSTFAQAPQWPIEDLKLTLNGGSRAPLANPLTCGVALAASSQLTSFADETPQEHSSEPFQLTGCPPAQFDPSFSAGTTGNQAGAFSSATVTLSRSDQDEELERIAVRMPPGLLGMLSTVQLCAEAQAQAASCPAQSEIGSATVGVGPGADPLFLSGKIYLTGPYEGAPFGLSIVVPAVAGPLDLGTIDGRARVAIDPSTAALSIASDPLPQSLDGIPLQIKTVNLDIDREGFIFNPTDCERLTAGGTLQSTDGVTAAVSSPFQAANCATLLFTPKLTALTHARPSRANGAYLHVKLVWGRGQANIAKLKLDLPKQLSARLATLRGACPAAVAQANPAACPRTSAVGTATVVTPVLGNPLSGSAYLISNGAAALPALEMVLQGEGVTLDLVGQASIGKGVVSVAFKALPDVPISTFDLVLGDGPRSLLAASLQALAKGSMCRQSLAMPIALTGQNGAVVKQTAHIAVSGCPAHRARRRA
jgi:hypothetical protein